MDLAKFRTELRAVDDRFATAAGAGGYGRVLTEWRGREADSEVLLSTGDATGAWITLIVCRRYGVTTFRRKRAKPTTVGVRAPKGFLDQVLEPHIRELASVFAAARVELISELASAWLGAQADEALYVDEELRSRRRSRRRRDSSRRSRWGRSFRWSGPGSFRVPAECCAEACSSATCSPS